MSQLIFLMALFYLIQAFAQNPGVFSLPLAFYLKEELHFSAAELQAFMGMITIPWMVKPLYGMISDGFPIFGYRRKTYFVLCYSIAAIILGWFCFQQSYSAFMLGAGLIAVSACVAFSDVLTDGTMVERGGALGKTGVLQAAQWTALSLGGAGLMFLGGYISEHFNLSFAFRVTFFVPLVGLLAALFLLPEKKMAGREISFRESLKSLWNGVLSRQFLTIVAFIACLNFSPTPPLLYYQQDVLKFSKEFIGLSGAFGLLAAGVGAILFGLFIGKISRRILLNLVIGLSALSSLGLLWMHDERSALLVSLFTGFVGMIAVLGILELAARICPAGAEGTSYALLMSIYNLTGNYGGGLIGGWFYDRHVPFATLVIIGAGFTLLCWLLIPLLKLEKE